MAEVKFKTSLGNFQESGVYGGHIKVPLDLAQKVMAKDKRVVCTLNDQISIHAGLISDGKGGFFININKELSKKLQAFEGDELEVHLEEDISKYGMAIPEGFEELLEQDPDAERYFHGLTKGKQRSLLHIINKPKNVQLKLEKAFIILDYLKDVRGNLDFKEVNEALKNNRFKR
jgi:hypothetical protein